VRGGDIFSFDIDRNNVMAIRDIDIGDWDGSMRPGELGGCALGLDGSGTAFMTLIDDYDIRMQQGSFWGFIYIDIYHFNLES
jgi:hypothetical protein